MGKGGSQVFLTHQNTLLLGRVGVWAAIFLSSSVPKQQSLSSNLLKQQCYSPPLACFFSLHFDIKLKSKK